MPEIGAWALFKFLSLLLLAALPIPILPQGNKQRQEDGWQRGTHCTG